VRGCQIRQGWTSNYRVLESAPRVIVDVQSTLISIGALEVASRRATVVKPGRPGFSTGPLVHSPVGVAGIYSATSRAARFAARTDSLVGPRAFVIT
jgi:hypothetical protein